MGAHRGKPAPPPRPNPYAQPRPDYAFKAGLKCVVEPGESAKAKMRAEMDLAAKEGRPPEPLHIPYDECDLVTYLTTTVLKPSVLLPGDQIPGTTSAVKELHREPYLVVIKRCEDSLRGGPAKDEVGPTIEGPEKAALLDEVAEAQEETGN